MRRSLCAVLLACTLVTGSLTAGELTTAQAQQLVSAAQSAEPGAKPREVTLSIDGKNVVFTVIRDAVGNVTARPVPGPDSAGITISQVSIQMRADAKGLLSPTSVVVVSNGQTVLSYAVQLNPDGTIANLYQPGAGGVAGPSKPKPVVGGIGSGSSTVVGGNTGLAGSASLPADRFPGFTSGQLGLPAGSESGSREASGSLP